MPDGGCLGKEEWILDHVSDRCPVMYVAQYSVLFSAYAWAERGFLPFSGGWAEQPADTITGLDIVYNAVHEKHERDNKANGG